MTTTTAPAQPVTLEEHTVLRHKPLTTQPEDGSAPQLQLESWSIFDVVYRLRDMPAPLNGLAYLQPDQAIKVWERPTVGAPWAVCAELGVRIVSALVCNGRFMVEGGSAKLNTHPKIAAWDISEPLFGRASQLKTPGRLRDFRIQSSTDQPCIPGLVVHNHEQLDTRFIGAGTFMNRVHRSPFGAPAATSGDPLHATIAAEKHDLALLRGCPLAVAAPSTEHTPCKDVQAFEVGEGIRILSHIPMPQVLSGLEDDRKGPDGKTNIPGVLTEYDSSWKTLLLEYLDKIGVTELYVHRFSPEEGSRSKPSWEGSEPVLVNPPDGYGLPISAFVPEVYRNPVSQAINGVCPDLGDSTMDYRLYEKMLPFAGTHLDASLLQC